MPNASGPTLPEAAQLKLFRLKEIPLPAGPALDALRLTTDEQVDLADLAQVIHRSPELTLRILRCANSAYFGQRRQIAGIEEAIIRVLGLTLTRSLVLTLAVSQPFNLKACPRFDAERHWFVACTTATLAERLVGHLHIDRHLPAGNAYSAGLLHNLGLLALVHVFPREADVVLRACPDGRPGDELRAALGIGPREAGPWLARHWGLPEVLARVMAHHQDYGYRGEDWPLAHLIGLTKLLADSLYRNEPEPVIPSGWFDGFPLTRAALMAALDNVRDDLAGLRDMARQLAKKGGRG
jgi:HD-like signal output (HDOD) protein